MPEKKHFITKIKSINCLICNKEFQAYSYPEKNRERKYCSIPCTNISRMGDGNVAKRPYVKKKLSESKLGNKWNQGRKFSQTHKDKISFATKNTWRNPDYRKLKTKQRLQQILPQKDTYPERMLQVALMINNIRFEKHYDLEGQPDIFVKPNICIFVDGDFYHANPTKYKPDDIIWKRPITRAKEIWAKDININSKLWKKGYVVLRIWEHDILNDSGKVAKNIIDLVKQSYNWELTNAR